MDAEVNGQVAAFDSASAMLRATARALRNEDFSGLGVTPPAARALAPVIDALPTGIRRALFARGGAREAIPAERVTEVRCDRLGGWAVDHYRGDGYPVAFVGSSNGALVHLATAMGAPWLPQTFLVPVRRRIRPGDLWGDLEWGRPRPVKWCMKIHHVTPDNQLAIGNSGASCSFGLAV